MTDIQQPEKELQALLSEILEAEPETVIINGKKRKIGWIHHGTERKFSHVIIKGKNQRKSNVKGCACILLNKKNGLWTKILLATWYHIYWRWLYYVQDIDQAEVTAVFNASKKKIQSTALATATTLAIAMTDTIMTIAQHESGQAAQGGVQPIL